MSDRVSVLIVDDSAYMRVVLKDLLESDPDIKVVGAARDGMEAIEKVKALSPKVVLLDIQMPKMDGVVTLQRIMKETPSRVVMLSAMDKMDDQLPLKALELGAIDFISKPSGPVSIDIVNFKDRIIEVVKGAAATKVEVLKKSRAAIPRKVRPVEEDSVRGHKVIVIGASMGGPRALEILFASLPRNLPASFLIVQHIPYEFSLTFAKRLDAALGPPVRLAADGLELAKGTAYLGPGGKHLTVAKRGRTQLLIKLDDGEPVNFVKPAADVLFKSAAECVGRNLLGVVLTGMGSDGAQGAVAIRHAGGRVIVQDEQTSVATSMPLSVIDAGVADKVLPLEKIPEEIIKFLEE